MKFNKRVGPNNCVGRNFSKCDICVCIYTDICTIQIIFFIQINLPIDSHYVKNFCLHIFINIKIFVNSLFPNNVLRTLLLIEFINLKSNWLFWENNRKPNNLDEVTVSNQIYLLVMFSITQYDKSRRSDIVIWAGFWLVGSIY